MCRPLYLTEDSTLPETRALIKFSLVAPFLSHKAQCHVTDRVTSRSTPHITITLEKQKRDLAQFHFLLCAYIRFSHSLRSADWVDV